MQVQEIMTQHWNSLSPKDTLQKACNEMFDRDFGFLPIQENGSLVGVVTDRDIAIRAVAKNKAPNTPLKEILTKEVITIHEDDDIKAAAKKMEKNQIRRLVVLNKDEKISGVISLADIATHCDEKMNGEIIHAISKKERRVQH